MTFSIKHHTQSAVVDDGVSGEVGPSEWNEDHDLSGTLDAAQFPILTGDVTTAGGALATTLATVNSNVGTFGSATQASQVTVNAKGLVTAAANVTVTPAASSITGGAALTKGDDTNVTLTLGGSPTTALLAAASITAGWSGTLSPARGGTGIANNAASTITISGSFATTFTVTGATGVTLPTTGTLATLAGSEELTNKTLTSSVGKGTWTASGTWTLPAHTLGGTVSGGGSNINNVIIGAVTPLAGSFTTLDASTTITATSANASALTVGRLGATTPALQIDASTATSITGIKIKSAASTGGVAVSAIGETNVNLTIDAAGSGTLTLAGTSTGAITLTRATSISSTTDSTSSTTGALIVAGGAGIAKNVRVAGFLYCGRATVPAIATAVAFTASQATDSNFYTTGAAVLSTGIAFGSINDDNSAFKGMEFKASQIYVNCGMGLNTTTDPGAGALLGTGSIKSNGATAGIGYATGAGGTVTQGAGSGKATTVVLNTVTGAITMNNAALNAATIVSFTLTNSAIAATDVLVLNHVSAGTPGSYTLNAQCGGGSATINVRNNTAGNLSEAIVIEFVLIKGVTS